MFPNHDEINVIKALSDALEIVEAGTRRLCSRDVDIAVADEIFEYILKELRKLNSSIAIRLEVAILDRVTERRLKEAATLLAYFKDPKFLSRVSKEHFVLEYASKTAIRNLIRDIYLRLFHSGPTDQIASETNQPQSDPTDEEPGTSAPPPKKSRDHELNAILEKNRQISIESREGVAKPKQSSSSVLEAIKTDMKYFESRGEMSPMLTQVMYMK